MRARVEHLWNGEQIEQPFSFQQLIDCLKAAQKGNRTRFGPCFGGPRREARASEPVCAPVQPSFGHSTTFLNLSALRAENLSRSVQGRNQYRECDARSSLGLSSPAHTRARKGRLKPRDLDPVQPSSASPSSQATTD